MTTKNITVTIAPAKTTAVVALNAYAAESATIYAEAIIEACAKLKLNPIDAIENTDDHPKLLKIATIEFAIGWLNGCAESHAVTVQVLWEQVAPQAIVNVAQRKNAPRARAS